MINKYSRMMIGIGLGVTVGYIIITFIDYIYSKLNVPDDPFYKIIGSFGLLLIIFVGITYVRKRKLSNNQELQKIYDKLDYKPEE